MLLYIINIITKQKKGIWKWYFCLSLFTLVCIFSDAFLVAAAEASLSTAVVLQAGAEELLSAAEGSEGSLDSFVQHLVIVVEVFVEADLLTPTP